MKKILVVGLSLALSNSAQAWWGSDFEESAYSCNDFNQLLMDGKTSSLDDIVEGAFQYFDTVYTDDEPVEDFYRTYVRPRHLLSSFHFRGDIVENMKQACALKNKDGDLHAVLDVAVKATYETALKDPRWSLCRALNDDILSTDEVLAYYQASFKSVVSSPKYGLEFVVDGLTEHCQSNAGEMIDTALASVVNPALQELKETAKQEAAAKRAAENQARHEANVKAYTGSMYSEDPESCQRFNKQHELSYSTPDDSAPFKAGLKLSLLDAAKELKPHQKAVFDTLMAESQDILVSNVSSNCYAGNITLADSLRSVERIARAKSEMAEALSVLVDEKKALKASCGRAKNCPHEMKYQAARYAAYANHQCETGNADGVLCFSEPQQFYQYALSESRVRFTEAQHQESQAQVDRGVSRNALYQALEVCKRDALDQGKRGDTYQDYIKTVCTPRATAALMEPLNAALKASEQALADAQQEFATARAQAITP